DPNQRAITVHMEHLLRGSTNAKLGIQCYRINAPCPMSNACAGGWVRDDEPIRKLTTILSADVAEFSRMMRADEDATYRALRSCRWWPTIKAGSSEVQATASWPNSPARWKRCGAPRTSSKPLKP